ncbi:MATE family efflux transporter [Bifidobacterium sp. 64T4]|uniref:MATE family efflux transporter n=1 Tax=Bifidobacterium pongonis TaxID=2834432 RepID=UPI001C5A1AC4|nr:MATE family efflux transporter [Bifidobacterium pongonis]MBW3094543.1 MATE family efflux transporter [Bifidobacterium pongonis]
MEKNLTTGGVFGTIVAFALPYLLSYFLQTLYGMADLFIAGQFIGVDGITAVANGSQVLYMLTVVIVGLAMGSTVTIGRAIGANRLDKASKAIGNTITLFIGVAIALTATLLLSVRGIVAVMGTPVEAVGGMTDYLTICFAGIPFVVAYNIISSVFRGLGDSKSPMYFIAVACLCNIALDYLFMGAMHLGAAGAAWGTILAQVISVIVSFIAIRRKRSGISLHAADLRPDRSVLGSMLTIGVPTAVQDGCIQIAFIIITVIANYRGLDDAAAVGVVEKVISALFLVPSAMLATVSAVSAQNIGAGKPERAAQTLRYATAITVIYGIIISIVVELTAGPIVGLFTTDATVVLLGVQYIRSYIVDSIFAGIHFCFSGFFAAYGKSYIGFIHNIVAITLVRVPGSYLASKLFPSTLFPMGLAAPAGSILSVLICLGFYAWLKHRGVFAAAAATR